MEYSGDARLISDSRFFDRAYYEAAAGAHFGDAIAAAQHYIDEGCSRKLSPSAKFDAEFYLSCNHDVAAAGLNPLVHFVRFGQKEGRLPLISKSPAAAKPVAPPETAWTVLQRRIVAGANHADAHLDSQSAVDVVIPVYRGFDDTLACIYTVLSAPVRTPYRLIVIDDRSPEHSLSDMLVRLRDMGLIILLRNERNLGFVGTANRGMSASERRDVVLLNSDTEVYGNWLDRLRTQAYSAERVATVTPFSNNATIFSYPFFAQPNKQALELSFPELDRMFQHVNARDNVTVPTGVGFCFYIRRAAIDEIGTLDEDLFGKGYGEENDFCMRAIENAWINLAALDTFVRHTGEVSFGIDAGAGKRAGYRRLLAVHPRYEQTISRYVEQDPMRRARERIDVARFARSSDGRGILMIEHGWGGGIERHVTDMAALLREAGVPALICAPAKGHAQHRLKHATSDDFPNLPPLGWAAVERSATLLRSLNLGHVHIHSLVGAGEADILGMIEAIRKAGLQYTFTVHDYAPICPRINMIDWGGTYCDSPSEAYCRQCIARDGTPSGPVDIAEWRTLYGKVVAGARRVVVPSQDTARRLESYGFGDGMLVRPHPVPGQAPVAAGRAGTQREARIADGIVRVGVIGAIGPHKGSRLLRTLCTDAASRRLPLRFILYGYTDRADDEDLPNLEITGAYADDGFAEILRTSPSDMALFLSVWPETFCYTLDHAFANALFPICFDHGAPAQRIRATGFGRTMPPSYMFDAPRINDLLLEVEPVCRSPVVEEDRTWSSPEDYYDLPREPGHPFAAAAMPSPQPSASLAIRPRDPAERHEAPGRTMTPSARNGSPEAAPEQIDVRQRRSDAA